MDFTTTDTSVLIEIIKEQNLTIVFLRKTIEELNIGSKIISEQIDYLPRSSLV